MIFQQDHVLLADALPALVLSAGFSRTTLVVYQRCNACICETLRDAKVSRLLAGSVDEHDRCVNWRISRKYDQS